MEVRFKINYNNTGNTNYWKKKCMIKDIIGSEYQTNYIPSHYEWFGPSEHFM